MTLIESQPDFLWTDHNKFVEEMFLGERLDHGGDIVVLEVLVEQVLPARLESLLGIRHRRTSLDAIAVTR